MKFIAAEGKLLVTDYFSLVPYIAGGLALVGLIGLLWSQPIRVPGWSRRSCPPAMQNEPSRQIVLDWCASEQIDFAPVTNSDGSDFFVLEREEYRVFESKISGTKRVEFRWRAATLEDAKQVASLHNAKMRLLDPELPTWMSDPTLVPELPDYTEPKKLRRPIESRPIPRGYPLKPGEESIGTPNWMRDHPDYKHLRD